MNTSISKEFDHDEAQNLRLMQAQDPRTSPYALKNLSKDPNWLVRKHVAGNPGTPEGSLWELFYDPDSRVRDAAFDRLDALGIRVAGHKAPVMIQSKAVEQSDSAFQDFSAGKASLDEKIASASAKGGNVMKKESPARLEF